LTSNGVQRQGKKAQRHPAGSGWTGRDRASNALSAPAAADEELPTRARVGWQTAIAATVEGLGYELVDIERAQRGLLRVTIDRVPGRAYDPRGGMVTDPAETPSAAVAAKGGGSEFVTVEDCEKVTRQLQFALEVEGLDYARLEVSSPGLDRPLKREADYLRFNGLAVQLVLKLPFKGRKNWQGVLQRSADLQPAAEPQAAAGAIPPEPAWALVFKDGKTEQVLHFAFDEVREARLVPVVNFKGRKAPDGGGAQASGAAPKLDGG
jgi:ribosome maturation factor RimP